MSKEDSSVNVGSNFIRDIIAEDLKSGKHKTIHVRFPPEPNGFLHIGHATTVCMNFEIAKSYEGATCNLRFDDTNPIKEEEKYVEAIQADIKWLGYDWEDRLFYSSDYFDKLYGLAVQLIKDGKAFVCELSGEEMKEYRGSLSAPGKNSPFRDRPIEESVDLFERMKNGEFEDGQLSLRAKIDMSSPVINMRDPIMYRIRKVTHQRTGDKWCIYPMYDFTHGQSDSFEGITHSLCSLEFQNHRPLYDWYVKELKLDHVPRQIEFARFNLSYTIMSKRKLLQLVEEDKVSGWDDPRMPTISGMKKRGYPAEAIRNFCQRIGMSKRENITDMSILEDEVRSVLNKTVPRIMAVTNPIKVVIENYPEDKEELISAPMGSEEFGERDLVMTREILIEDSDFLEDAPKKFFRLSVGREVRLRYGYVIKCNEVVKNSDGKVVEIRATYDPETLGGKTPDGRKVKGIIHWVSAKKSHPIKVNLYDRLFSEENPAGDKDSNFLDCINPDSYTVLKESRIEWAMDNLKIGKKVQFERLGYFIFDTINTVPTFNRTVTLRDGWAKVKKKN